MRYCKQRDKYSCGAIALLNVDKFFGRWVTYQDLPKYQELVDCRRDEGTKIVRISKVIGRASRRAWESSRQFLRDGNCIMILCDEGAEAHYFVMIEEAGVIVVVNRFNHGVGTPSTCKISPQYATRMLRSALRTWYVDKETGLL